MLVLGFVLDWTIVDTGFGFCERRRTVRLLLHRRASRGCSSSPWASLALLNVMGKLPANQPWPLIFLAGTGLAAILMLLRIILGARFDFADRGIGMYGAFVVGRHRRSPALS